MIERLPLVSAGALAGKTTSADVSRVDARRYDPTVAVQESAADPNISNIAQDLLRGADEIAFFLFGDRHYRRRVYHLVATNSRIPVFKLGSMICARRSTLLAWIDQEIARRR